MVSKQCSGCFAEYDEQLDMCPYCGYEEGEGAQQALHLSPGTLLKDTYIVGNVLGYGGFGVTYLGWNTVLQQKVAIKEYLPSEFSTRMAGQTRVTIFNGDKSEQFHDGVEKFVEEANRLARFRDTDGIVRIFESFQENNTAYIVMEYLDGETLTQYLEKNGAMSADEAVRLMTPIIRSLQTVHEQGIIHRDIAPDNIMVTKKGEVKLIDFGAARYATTSHSRSLTVVIKPGYSPEEQYRSRGDQGPWTDVYAVGATMYRMITGQVPPDAMERRAYFEGKKKDILHPLSKYTREISDNQETAILNAMNVRIEDRTPDMQTFEQELHAQDEVKRRNGKIKKIDVLKWPLWMKISIPAAACIVVTLLGLFAAGVIGFDANLQEAMYVPDGMSRVPSLISSEISDAEARLEEARLLYSITGKEYSDEIPANRILEQDLAAGSIVSSNAVVSIRISGGAAVSEDQLVEKDENGQLSVADVQYRTLEEALELLGKQGFEVEVTEEASDTIAAGVVISQNPVAGTSLEPGARVGLVVSTGSASFDMPSVVNQKEETAKDTLASAGLSVVVEYANDDGVPEGTVLSQSIAAGTRVQRGTSVTLVVSSGKALVTVENVVGKSEAEARSLLEAQGFQVRINQIYSHDVPKGSVTHQSLPAGSAQEKGAAIVLTVSQGREPDDSGSAPAETEAQVREFVITYDGNGGSLAGTGSQAVREGNRVTLRPAPETAKSYTIAFNANGGSVSGASRRLSGVFTGWNTKADGSGTAYSAGSSITPSGNMTLYAQWEPSPLTSLPVPSRDYYVFAGWYTASGAGSRVESGYVPAGNMTLYAHWAQKAVSGWVPVSQVPDGAQIVQYKWTYDLTTYKDSKNATEPGWTANGSEWVKSGTGSVKWASFPSGFDKNHSLYKKYNGKRITGYEKATQKRVVTSEPTVSYIYWHWMFDCGGAGAYNRTIASSYGTHGSMGYFYKYFGAYESTDNAPYVSGAKAYKWRVGGSYANTQGSYWWFRMDVKQTNYTDYYKLFHWKKTESKETSPMASHTSAPSGEGISGQQEYVQYRAR